MHINAVLAGIAVSHIDTAVEWYESFLKQPVTARPMPSLAEWQLDSCRLQLIADPQRAGSSLVTFDIDDLDVVAGALVDSGLCEPLEITSGDTVRFTQVADPDRNTLTLVESPTAER